MTIKIICLIFAFVLYFVYLKHINRLSVLLKLLAFRIIICFCDYEKHTGMSSISIQGNIRIINHFIIIYMSFSIYLLLSQDNFITHLFDLTLHGPTNPKFSL